MSQAVADQLFLAYMGRPADTQWRDATSTLTTAMGDKPSAALQAAFYGQAVAEGVYAATDSPSTVVNKFFLQTFGFAARADEQTFWGNLITSGTYTPATLIWQMFASYVGALSTLPSTYQVAVQSKLIAEAAFSNALTDPTINAAYSQLNSAATAAGRAYLTPIVSQATAAPAITGVATTVAALSLANGTTFTLTNAVDILVGTPNGDTFNATDFFVAGGPNTMTLTALDSIDGGAGIDTLNVTNTIAIAVPASATVKNVELANLTSAATVTGDVSGWTGLTTLKVAEVGGTAGAVTAAATTNVTLADSAAAAATISVQGGKDVTVTASKVTGGGTINVGTVTAPKGVVTVTANELASQTTVTADAINVTGGTTVNVTANLAGAVTSTITAGVVTVLGTADTTSVSVTETNAATAAATVSGVVNGAVDIGDANAGNGTTATGATKAGTITAVSLSGFAAATISSAALNTLTLAGTGTTVTTLEAGSTAATNTALALNLNGGTLTGALTDGSNQFKTININTGTKAGVTSTLTAAIVDTALTTVTVAGAGNLKADLTTASVTSIDASTSTGNNTVSVDGTKSTYTGGAGNDAVTITAAPTKAIAGGLGVDTLTVNIATAFNASANTKISGFETLGLGALAGAVAYDATGFTNVTTGNTAGAASFTNVAAGTGMAFTAANANVINYTLANATGLTDVVNVTQALGATGADLLTATGVETVNITASNTTSANTGAVAIMNTLTLSAAPSAGATSTINVSSGALTGVTLIDATDLTISSVNASGVQGDGKGTAASGFVWTSGILAATTATTATVVTGSANGGDTINMAAAVDLVTITETKGANTLTGSLTNKSTITGGTGVDTILGGNLADTIVGGGGADQITAGTGADKITVTGNTATIIQAAGASGANTSTTIQTSELTSTFDVVFGATAGLKLNLGNANIVTGATLVTAGTNLAASAAADTAVFARGAYDAAAGTFTFAANGADTAITYDSNIAGGITAETIILVGFVSGASTAVGGVVTLV